MKRRNVCSNLSLIEREACNTYTLYLTLFILHFHWSRAVCYQSTHARMTSTRLRLVRTFLFFTRYDVICDLLQCRARKNEIYLLSIGYYTLA